LFHAIGCGTFERIQRSDFWERVKVNEKSSVTVSEQGVGVGSGVGVEPLIKPLAKKDGKVLGYNVTTKKDDRRPKGTHPNPTLAQTIATMSLAGFTIKQVCEALKVSPETLSEHYDDEMKHGRTRMMTDVVSSLAQRAIAGSDTAAIFLAKARLGWSDRQQVELTGKDGGPIEIAQRTEILQTVNGLLRKGITIDGESEPLD
jgi:hypothetical protein